MSDDPKPLSPEEVNEVGDRAAAEAERDELQRKYDLVQQTCTRLGGDLAQTTQQRDELQRKLVKLQVKGGRMSDIRFKTEMDADATANDANVKPLSSEEVNKLRFIDETHSCSILEVRRLAATVHDRERQRNESLALNRQVLCFYCGHVETILENEDRTIGLRRVMTNHIKNCSQHPLKHIAAIERDRDRLDRLSKELASGLERIALWISSLIINSE